MGISLHQRFHESGVAMRPPVCRTACAWHKRRIHAYCVSEWNGFVRGSNIVEHGKGQQESVTNGVQLHQVQYYSQWFHRVYVLTSGHELHRYGGYVLLWVPLNFPRWSHAHPTVFIFSQGGATITFFQKETAKFFGGVVFWLFFIYPLG